MKRYAIYYAPGPGPLADLAAAWLGWDPVAGQPVLHPEVPGLPRPVAELTATPRKYGFHGTLKPPFRLAGGMTAEGLRAACAALAARQPAVRMEGLRLHRLGGFLALTPIGDPAALGRLAGACVRDLDPFRAAPDAAEVARRRPERLTERQRALLADWGYPYVFEEFRFHLTLTGNLPEEQAAAVAAALEPVFAPLLPAPFTVADICLFGEDASGMFHLLERHRLAG